MRALRLLGLFAGVALGAVIGGLNSQPVAVDLGIGRVGMHLGEALLAALLIGVLLGGLALWPRHRARSAPPPASVPVEARDDEE